jgi:hypothetical protein
VPPALRPNGTLGKHERLVGIGATFGVFTDDAVDDAALAFSPLNAGRPLAGAAEAESFFRGTALSRYLNKSRINDDAIFRKRDRNR